MLTLATFSVFAALANASPTLSRGVENVNKPVVDSQPNALNFVQQKAGLPNVAIFATGGTIAGSGSSSTQTSGYKAGVIGVATLINSVPELSKVANVAGIQVANVDSKDMTSTILLSLSKQINELVCGDDSMAGAVVTHGTDTLEETAFFLDATVNCGKPVVIVGAMRPASAISADGPFNLLEAVTVASDPSSRDRGALIVLNDRITSAYYVTKTNANNLDSFRAYEQGNLGALTSNKPYYYFGPARPTGKRTFDISKIKEIPRVDILMGYEEMPVDLLHHSVENGAKGIVIAGTGAGSVQSDFEKEMEKIINKKIPVIQSTRATSGQVPFSSVAGPNAEHIASGYLNPQKSRILLGLLLAQGKTFAEVAEAFGPSKDY
ncbi:unnamed protein product [Diplocarpon coronariae]